MFSNHSYACTLFKIASVHSWSSHIVYKIAIIKKQAKKLLNVLFGVLITVFKQLFGGAWRKTNGY
jgi:hypothetical protein